MSNATDRRAPGSCRIPFDAMVEVGGALGPSFEAQAINLSEEGMSLRTAYLPDIGQPVMCRFDAGNGTSVVAAGEVLWKDDLGNGGEFGIRFTNLDGPSTAALQRILGSAAGREEAGHASDEAAPPGRKVRLHIEGLASPMRARIREQMTSGVTAYSELGFLQMGRPLELEDATSGSRRPAFIDRVEVAVDDASRIPQLVVSLRYADVETEEATAGADDAPETPRDVVPAYEHAMEEGEVAEAPAAMSEHPESVSGVAVDREPAQATANEDGESDAAEDGGIKGAFARGAAKVTPAVLALVKRAKTTASLLAARARKREEAEEAPVRRTTAPAPGGGLHAAGRKVVRGSVPDNHFEEAPAPPAPRRLKITKKKAAAAGAIVVAAALLGVALHRPASPQLASAPPAEPEPAALGPDPDTAAATPVAAKPVTPPLDPLAAAAMGSGIPRKATPFVNGHVGTRPNVIKIKMDGPIEAIQGAAQPTGFTVVIPNRKPVEPTASVFEKDSRIAGVNVTNEPTGVELTVTFKDGVPPYMVRANGETLEMVLARASAHGDKAEAKKRKTKKR